MPSVIVIIIIIILLLLLTFFVCEFYSEPQYFSCLILLLSMFDV
jgi:hypothetical protein